MARQESRSNLATNQRPPCIAASASPVAGSTPSLCARASFPSGIQTMREAKPGRNRQRDLAVYRRQDPSKPLPVCRNRRPAAQGETRTLRTREGSSFPFAVGNRSSPSPPPPRWTSTGCSNRRRPKTVACRQHFRPHCPLGAHVFLKYWSGRRPVGRHRARSEPFWPSLGPGQRAESRVSSSLSLMVQRRKRRFRRC